MKNMDKWPSAAAVGLGASLLMFVFMFLGIYVLGVAPFNVPPSEAFLTSIGLGVGPLPLLAHFGYGAFWSVVLVAIYGTETNVSKGLALAGGLWLFMMVVYSPVIGWGFFGISGTPSLMSDAPLHLQAGPKYLVVTLLLHLVYGLVVGGANGMLMED